MKAVILFIIAILAINVVCADDKELKFISNQSEYYFLVDENAIVPFEVENRDGEISGQMTYTITQNVQQSGMSYQSTNSQSQPADIKEDKFYINLGTSNQPLRLDLEISFDYTDEDDNEVSIFLPDISVIFVNKPEQKQNKENKQESKSQKEQESQKSQQQQQSEEQKQAQQQQQNQLQDKQNKMVQESPNMQALKNEANKQNKEIAADKKNIEGNKKFKQMEEELKSQGYERKDDKIVKAEEDKKEFEYNYENKDGEKAKITGDVKNDSIENIQKSTEDDFKKNLENNKDYEKLKKELEKQGYEQKNQTIEDFKNNNTGSVKTSFENKKGNKVNISSEINDDQIKSNTINVDRSYLTEYINSKEKYNKLRTGLEEDGYSALEPRCPKENDIKQINKLENCYVEFIKEGDKERVYFNYYTNGGNSLFSKIKNRIKNGFNYLFKRWDY